MNKEELEKETAEYFKSICGDYNEEYERTGKRHYWVGFDIKNAYLAGAEFGYNKAKEEMQEQNYSLFDFVMQYEDGKFKCKDKSGKEFESVDGETWKEIVLPELKESE